VEVETVTQPVMVCCPLLDKENITKTKKRRALPKGDDFTATKK